jgi:hypothetical protein
VGQIETAPPQRTYIVLERWSARLIIVDLMKTVGISELSGEHLWSPSLNHI